MGCREHVVLEVEPVHEGTGRVRLHADVVADALAAFSARPS